MVRDENPPDSPQTVGVREQLARVRLFLDEAQHEPETLNSFRKQIAACYFGRAALELMREMAKSRALKCTIAELDAEFERILPQYSVIKDIRIMDFHQSAVVPKQGATIFGKVTVPPYEHVELQIDLNYFAPIVSIAKPANKKVPSQFLTVAGTSVQNREGLEPEPLIRILTGYLGNLPQAIRFFESQLLCT